MKSIALNGIDLRTSSIRIRNICDFEGLDKEHHLKKDLMPKALEAIEDCKNKRISELQEGKKAKFDAAQVSCLNFIVKYRFIIQKLAGNDPL